MKKQPATVRVARWSATHPWRAIGLWVVFVAVCVMVGGAAGTKQAGFGDMGVGESGRAEKMAVDGGLAEPAVENVLITPRSGQLDRPAAAQVADEVATRMTALSGQVKGVGDPVTAPDGSAVLVPVTMSGDADTAKDRLEPLRDVVADVQRDHPDLRIEQTGAASIPDDLDQQLADDFAQAEGLSLPITLVILLVAFGAIIAAGVPVLMALSAVGAATGLYGLASHVFPDAGTVSSVILMMGMAVGVDYSLFYLRREREERARGRGRIDAIEIAAATSGRAVVVSAFAVIVSMAGLYVADDLVFAGLATGSIIVVAVAMLGSLTVLPALLAKLGRAVDRPRVPLLWRLTNRTGTPRLWPVLLRPATRHPVATLLVSFAALAALALPATGLKLWSTATDELPRSMPAMQAYDRMTNAFPGKNTPHRVVVEATAEQAGQVGAALDRIVDRTGKDPLFAHDVAPEVRASDDGRVHTLTLASPYGSNSDEAKTAVKHLRADIVPETLGSVDGARYAVSGEAAGNVDYADHQREKLPWVIGFVLLLTFVMMAATFRSVVVALTAIAINLLSALSAFGFLVLVFQHTWAEGLLGFSSTGGVVAWLPLYLFVVLFGLSMDYHVFVLSRIREAAMAGLSTREAVTAGITRSAGVVTSAAVVMVSVFAVFGSLSMMEMKQLGVGLAVAVLLDAVVVRSVLLPSLMVLLGRANWWPGRLSRRASAPRHADYARPTVGAGSHRG